MKNINSKQTDALFSAVLELRSMEECRRFFEDLCTISELKSMGQRMEVAKMLSEKRIYTEIADKTGASTATISRVNRCINYGRDGYNLVIERLKAKEKSNEKLQ